MDEISHYFHHREERNGNIAIDRSNGIIPSFLGYSTIAMENSRLMKHVSLTEGKALRSILIFAIHIFIGNVIGVLYGWIDGLLLSKYVGTSALAGASVGGSSIAVESIFASAFPVGMSALTSKYFGEKNENKLKENFYSSLLLNIVVSLLLLGITLALVKPVLSLMNVEEGTEIYSYAKTYAYISSFSLIGVLFYSFLVSYLRARGESKAPLFFIVLFCLVSIIADLVLTMGLHLGIYGASFSPIIAYAVSDIVGFFILFHKHKELRLDQSFFRLNWIETKKELILSLPLALQLSLISVGGVFAQSVINSYGEEAILGLTVAGKITGVLGLYINGVANAIGPFLSQNIGKGQAKRGKDGLNKALLISVVLALVDCLIAYLLIIPTSRLFLGTINETALHYTRMSVYFFFGSILLAPCITLFRYALESADSPYWNLFAGFAQLATQLLFVLLLSRYMGESAVVGSSFFSSILPCLILVAGAIKTIYSNKAFKANLNDDINKEKQNA